MRICNPMTDPDLDDLGALLDPQDDDRVLDIACGHGEALLRMAERAAVVGTGVDLSPWVLVRALGAARDRSLRGTLEWQLGDGADTPHAPEWDIVTCLGASWIWDGFEGTAQAVADRCKPGGRIAIGDVQVRPDADPADLATVEDPALHRGEQVEVLRGLGLIPIVEMGFSTDAWADYDARVRASAASYAAGHEGDPERDFRAMAANWDKEEHLRALDWTVWVARKA
jgi:SAM-dependent methyltransferase